MHGARQGSTENELAIRVKALYSPFFPPLRKFFGMNLRNKQISVLQSDEVELSSYSSLLASAQK